MTLTAAYDSMGRRTLLQDSLGGTITSTYDNVGNLTDRQFSASGMTTLDVSLGYTALNQLAAITRTANPPSPFSTYTSLTYDAAGRMTFVKHYDNAVPPPHGGHTFETITYTYDAASRLATEVRNGTTTTYQYDATNELTNDTANSYSFDLAGNRTMTGYTTGSANELTNFGLWTYTYDNNGNLTKKTLGASAETWYFGYDNLNRMTSAKQEQTDGGTLLMQATYVYDVFGDRIEKDVWTSSTGTVVTRFAYDGQNAFADLNSSNQLQMRRLYGDAVDQLFARENSSGTLAWYLTDRLGSVRDVLNNSSTVLDHIDYDAFGNATETNSPNGDRYKWTAREFDSETGLQYNRARYYGPAIGRWISQDPLGFITGDSNMYLYIRNRPTGMVDPSGMSFVGPQFRLPNLSDIYMGPAAMRAAISRIEDRMEYLEPIIETLIKQIRYLRRSIGLMRQIYVIGHRPLMFFDETAQNELRRLNRIVGPLEMEHTILFDEKFLLLQMLDEYYRTGMPQRRPTFLKVPIGGGR